MISAPTWFAVAKLGTTDCPGEAKANGELIVRACNAHAELLDACKWALPLVLQWFNEKPHCQDHSGLTALREAIAKAEGRA